MITDSTVNVRPEDVHSTLKKFMLADGYPLVLDMRNSQGMYLLDRVTGRKYIDFFTFFASNPLGMNHPGLRNDPEFVERLLDAAINKVSNSDIYTEHMARFVRTFHRVGMNEDLPNAFFISGGSLAVENTLKVAFDWKVRKNYEKGYRFERGHKILHFEKAFHGRSGYTMSMTNTVIDKVALFPKYDWPRVLNPTANVPLTEENLPAVEAREKLAIAQIHRHLHDNLDDIAAILIEPIQGEGGDNHFRPQFLQQLRDIADENDVLLIFDEVQTGVGLTGTFWAYQGLGVKPDMLAFGKKMQVCGLLASKRVREVKDNVFEKSSRINSTWGGNIVDMVRADRILQIIESEQLVDNARTTGIYLQSKLSDLSIEFPFVKNPRGQGLFCAFDMPCAGSRNRLREICYEEGLIILGCGEKSIRFRPALIASPTGLDEGLALLRSALGRVASEGHSAFAV